jgi:protein SCO1/2
VIELAPVFLRLREKTLDHFSAMLVFRPSLFRASFCPWLNACHGDRVRRQRRRSEIGFSHRIAKVANSIMPQARTSKPPTGVMRSILLTALCMFSLSGCGNEVEETLPAPGVAKLSQQFTGDYSLINTEQQAVTDEDYRGKVQFIYFGFATCPDVCPMALGRMSAALNDLSQKELDAIAPIFITVDPERDSPEKLRAYLEFDRRIIGLTGTPDAVEQAKNSFKVYAVKEPLPDSEAEYTMNHSSILYIVDRDGAPRLALQDTLGAAEIAVELRKAIAWR